MHSDSSDIHKSDIAEVIFCFILSTSLVQSSTHPLTVCDVSQNA